MKTNKGFTVFELFIVIAIISVMVSVVVGAMNDSKKTDKERCLEEMEYTTIQYLRVNCLKYLDTDINLIKN